MYFEHFLWNYPQLNATRPFWCLINIDSTLARVTAWCLTALSHYMSQCWTRSLSPYGTTRPQWDNKVSFLFYIASYSFIVPRSPQPVNWQTSTDLFISLFFHSSLSPCLFCSVPRVVPWSSLLGNTLTNSLIATQSVTPEGAKHESYGIGTESPEVKTRARARSVYIARCPVTLSLSSCITVIHHRTYLYPQPLLNLNIPNVMRFLEISMAIVDDIVWWSKRLYESTDSQSNLKKDMLNN